MDINSESLGELLSRDEMGTFVNSVFLLLGDKFSCALFIIGVC